MFVIHIYDKNRIKVSTLITVSIGLTINTGQKYSLLPITLPYRYAVVWHRQSVSIIEY